MIFVTIREEFAPKSMEGMNKMAKDFQKIMQTGGLGVGIVGTEVNQMIAIANNIKELIEIRKFMTQMEEVLSIEYDKSKFVGKYVSKQERIKHDLPLEAEDDDEHDEL